MAKTVSSSSMMNPKQEAKSTQTSPDRLRALAAQTAELASMVAGSEACPSDLLHSLARHKDAKVRKRVASNPQTPADVAANLVSQFPEQILDNPAFEIYLRERPDLLTGVEASAIRSLVKRDICPVGFLAYAASIDDMAIQLAVLTNAATPRSVVEGLVQSAQPLIKEAAQWHVNLQKKLPKNRTEILATSIEKSLRTEQPNDALNALAYVLANILEVQGNNWPKNVSEADILRFRTLGFIIVPLAINPSTPVSVLEHLAADQSVRGWDGVACNPSTPATLLERLARHKSENVRAAVANNKAAPPSILEFLAQDKKEWVRWEVAANPSTPKYVLERLAMDRNETVRSEVASNRSTPSAVLECLAEDKEEFVRSSAARNPSTSRERLKMWVDNEMERFGLAKASSRTSTHWDRFGDELTLESSEGFLATLAANPSTPASALERLAEVKRIAVAKGLARNPSAPPLILESLSVEKSAAVRAAVGGNSSAPTNLLEKLSLDDKNEVRESIAKNTLTSASVLSRLAEDGDANIRHCVAKNPSTPGTVLESLAKETDTDIRAGVAKNASTPVSVLERLVEDADKNILVAVAFNPSLPGAILRRLFLLSTEVPLEIRDLVRHCYAEKNVLANLMALRAQYLAKLTSVTSASASRLLGLRLQDCPSASLAKAQRSSDWRERCVIAANPSTPLQVAERLTRDGNALVRATALDRMKSSELGEG